MSPSRPSGGDFAVTWELIENLADGSAHRAALTLTNNGEKPLGTDNWSLYFNSVRMVRSSSFPSQLEAVHVNGDLFRISPGADFKNLPAGETLRAEYLTSDWTILETDAPDGFYFVFDEDGETVAEEVGSYFVVPFENPDLLRRSRNDVWPVATPAERFRNNAARAKLPKSALSPIIPTPLSLTSRDGRLSLESIREIRHDRVVDREASYLADFLEQTVGRRPVLLEDTTPAPGSALLRTGRVGIAGSAVAAGDEAYVLDVDPDNGVTITGSDRAGLFYGIQSLRALVEPGTAGPDARVPAVRIEDRPRFQYRGFMLDVARNFHSKETVMRLLEAMAFYKLNRFHFHLTDDEGWRLEISGLPELTEVGGRRGHSEAELDHLRPSLGSGPDVLRLPGSGFYTRSDFIEILRWAKTRHIEVVPELDMPGHARAAIRAMRSRFERLRSEGDEEGGREYLLRDPEDTSAYESVQMWTDNVVDVCSHSTYHFLQTVVDDIVSMFEEAGATLTTIHTGGDEVPSGAWDGSPACSDLFGEDRTQQELSRYFVDQFRQIIAAEGLVTAGWEEIALVRSDESDAPEPDPDLSGEDVRPYAWNSVWGWGGEDTAYRIANAGLPVVMSNASNLYFDLAYEKSPQEPGAYWAGFVDTRSAFELIPLDIYKNARRNLMGAPIEPDMYSRHTKLTRRGQTNILGIQGQLWSENARGPALAEYLIFPKLLGLAERAWAADPPWARVGDDRRRNRALEEDWNRFANQLGQKELARLGELSGGLVFRVPPPGALVDGRLLRANVAFPGLEIRYTTDGTTPGPDSPLYTEPVEVSGIVNLRSFVPGGRGSRLVSVESGD